MTKFVYAIRDLKTSFLSPFTEMNDDAAKRGFSFAISREPDLIGFSPADFSLFRIGSFDDVTGRIIPEMPVLIADAVNLIGVDVNA